MLVDEVYLDAAVPPRRSAAHLGPEFVCTNSLTKVYGLSGLRCGWILAEPDLAERMWRLNDLFGVNQAHQAERLACIAFDRIDEVIGDDRLRSLERNRSVSTTSSRTGADLECAPADTRHHRLSALVRRRHRAARRSLREHYDTSVVPGRWFEMPDHFRIGFGLARVISKKRLKRLGLALDELA